MAPDPSAGRGLLLLTCCLAAAHAHILGLSLPWFLRSADPTMTLASEPRKGSAVQPTADPTTHVAPQEGPTEQATAAAVRELPLEELEAGQGRAPTAPVALAQRPDMREENVAGVGAKVLNVAQGIRSFIRLWNDAAPTESPTGAGTLAPVVPTDPLTLPESSSTAAGSRTAPGPSSTASSSQDTPRTHSSTLPVPTQLLASSSRPRARLRKPLMPPPTPGTASSPSSIGWPQRLDSQELLPAAAFPDQHTAAPRRTPRLSPLVTGSAHTASSTLPADLSALHGGHPAEWSPVSVLIRDSGDWGSHVANSSGPGLANTSTPLAPAGRPAGRCRPLPSYMPLCRHLGIGLALLPNHLGHESDEEVRGAAQAWGDLLQTNCHHFLGWFFCLLLAPPCGAAPLPGPPPCRQFCEALEDECWSHLEGHRLPVACASLPTQEDGYCVFIGAAAALAPEGSALLALVSSPHPL
uniref:Collagen type XVIII alpha 1 chain n=1 Tax=Loxodonta africana TaxID=9785 RepID=G3U3E3_LOXAF